MPKTEPQARPRSRRREIANANSSSSRSRRNVYPLMLLPIPPPPPPLIPSLIPSLLPIPPPLPPPLPSLLPIPPPPPPLPFDLPVPPPPFDLPLSATRAFSSNTQMPYSTTSDHKPVSLEFKLTEIHKNFIFKGISYNMSYLSDLGPISPWGKGSEAYLLSRIIGADKRLYWKNAANLVHYFFSTEDPNVMFFQEMNDRNKISTTNPYEVTLENGAFMGGYQALLELLNGGSSGIVYSDEIPAFPEDSGSYYVHGSFQNYCFVAYSVEKDGTYPTVLTIWKKLHLGDFENFYGNDIGAHPLYQPITPRTPNRHLGRNFSCVRTTNKANLINIHGPNSPCDAFRKLKVVIEYYMMQAQEKFEDTWNTNSTVIGGDSNDALNLLGHIDFNDETYTYKDIKPLTCCAEYSRDTLLKPYRQPGDILFVAKPKQPILIYQPLDTTIAYGHYNVKKSKKSKKSKKRNPYKQQKKRITIKH